jgi:hypothetical protein
MSLVIVCQAVSKQISDDDVPNLVGVSPAGLRADEAIHDTACNEDVGAHDGREPD